MMQNLPLKKDILTSLYWLSPNYPETLDVLRSVLSEPCYLLWGDLDKFKTFNDFNGLSIGDKMITETGRIILEYLPENCFAFRSGGDRFLVALPSISLQKAKEIAEEIRKRVLEIHFDAYGDWTAISRGITFSIVTASNQTEISKTLEIAERLNLQAKREGGNRVICEH